MSFALPNVGVERESFTVRALRDFHGRVARNYRDFVAGRLPISEVVRKPLDLFQYAFVTILDGLHLKVREGIGVTTMSNIPIGCGMISHRHMQIYQNINSMADRLGFRAKVVACAGRSPEKLKAWGERYHFAEQDLYLDYRELLKRDDIDTVDVCVHNNLHVPISIEVMKAGFDCYCEKPAAASWHDMNMMMKIA